MPNVNSKITVGFELEIATLSRDCDAIVSRNNWLTRHDASVVSPYGEPLPDSREIISRPVAPDVTCGQDGQGMAIDFAELDRVIDDLARCAEEVNASCGFHVHLGRPVANGTTNDWGVPKSEWGPERARTFLAIGLLLEDELFNLCPKSRESSSYCRRIKAIYSEHELTSYYPLGRRLPDNKYECGKRRCWLNLVETQRAGTDARLLRGHSHGLGTVEIRMLGNVRRAEYMKAWARLWVTIAAYVAYVPTSLAVLHCVSGGLIPHFDSVRNAKLATTSTAF